MTHASDSPNTERGPLPAIELQRGDCQDEASFLAERIYEFNSEATGYFDAESFAATQRDQSGAIVAGISGHTWGGICFIDNLWVARDHRGAGLGAALLAAAEQNARARGCQLTLLSSHSFQSPGFYRRMGYEQRAVIADHPIGHADFLFAKRLT